MASGYFVHRQGRWTCPDGPTRDVGHGEGEGPEKPEISSERLQWLRII